MSASRAAELYKRLEQGGAKALDDLIADREAESLFLDFKRSADDGTGPRLLSDDSKNLSKSVSGFGNSSGGVVIWGVDCRRDASGNEVPSKVPLTDAHGYRTKLESALSRATIPPPAGVHMLVLQDDPSQPAGYVVMRVPQSHQGPLRSVDTKHYHMRAGSAFEIVPHDVLAGMFGRPPRPDVFAMFISSAVRADRHEYLDLRLRIVAANGGAVIAERPYLAIELLDFPLKGFELTVTNPSDYIKRRGPLPSASVVGNVGVVLAPRATEELCTFTIKIPSSYANDIRLECTIGAQGAAPRQFALVATPASIAAALPRARAGDPNVVTTDVFSIESD